MTDEELRKIDEMTDMLLKNGFDIKDAVSFSKGIGQADFTETINKLLGLEKSIKEGTKIDDFALDMADSLDQISKLINSDNYFRNSIGHDNFLNILNDLGDKFKVAQDYRRAEEIVAEREKDVRDIVKRLHELNESLDMDPAAKTKETIRLTVGLNNAREAHKNAVDFSVQQKTLYENSLKDFDLTNYKNDLLQKINALDNSYREISMDSENKSKLGDIIRATRDKIVVLGLGVESSKQEYKELCEEFGLEKTNRIENNLNINDILHKVEEPQEIVEPEKTVEEPTLNTPEEPTPVVDPTVNDEKITSLDGLVNALKTLNPDLTIVKEMTESGKEKQAVACEDIANVVLPNGFKYDEDLGINNKIDDQTPYVSIPVNLTKKLEINGEELQKEQPVAPQVEPSEEKAKVATPDKVPSGKIKVTKIRKAVIAPYVKSILQFGALGVIGAGALGLGAMPLLPAAALGASIGAIGQGIYQRLVKQGGVKIPEFENPEYIEHPEYATVAKFTTQSIKTKVSSLLNSVKFLKNKKRMAHVEEVKRPEPVQQPVVEQPQITNLDALNQQETYENKSNIMVQNQPVSQSDFVKRASVNGESQEQFVHNIEDELNEVPYVPNEYNEMSMGGR